MAEGRHPKFTEVTRGERRQQAEIDIVIAECLLVLIKA
jgi:hypothetical protein